MPMEQTEALSLTAAYQFGDARGLAAEVEAIRAMRIDTSVRRGYIAHLLRDRGLLDAFIDESWSFGRTPAGEKKLKSYDRLRKRHVDLSSRPVVSGEPEDARPMPVTADDLAKWRREILRMLDSLDARAVGEAGPVARIMRLKAARVIPRHIAALMAAFLEMRNAAEYEDRQPTDAEGLAVRHAWIAVREWARPQ